MAEYKSAYTGQQIDAGIGKANTALQPVAGKGLSTNDYTDADKTKLSGIDMSTKQDTLVSGTNIKTINNTSILGSGNITIEGGTSDVSVESSSYPFELTDSNGNAILRINNTGNLITSSFDSSSVAVLPTSTTAGQVLTSTDNAGRVEWTTLSISDEKKYQIPWYIEQHRGWSSSSIHENTLPAFKRGWLNGANMIELDARLSLDNVYICSHDDTVTDINGTTYTISQTNSSVLTDLILSHDTIYGDCKLPLTETILKFCVHAGIICNLDCKLINPQTIAELVNACGMSGKVMYANTTTANALTILQYDPHAMFLFRFSELNSWVTALENEEGVIERCWCWEYAATTTAENIATAHAKGVRYLMAGISSYNKTKFALLPDVIEFTEETDCKTICEQYLNDLDF